jgi:hypothetical protein
MALPGPDTESRVLLCDENRLLQIVFPKNVVIIDKNEQGTVGFGASPNAGIEGADTMLNNTTGGGMPGKVQAIRQRRCGCVVHNDEFPLAQVESLEAKSIKHSFQLSRIRVEGWDNYGTGSHESET